MNKNWRYAMTFFVSLLISGLLLSTTSSPILGDEEALEEAKLRLLVEQLGSNTYEERVQAEGALKDYFKEGASSPEQLYQIWQLNKAFVNDGGELERLWRLNRLLSKNENLFTLTYTLTEIEEEVNGKVETFHPALLGFLVKLTFSNDSVSYALRHRDFNMISSGYLSNRESGDVPYFYLWDASMAADSLSLPDLLKDHRRDLERLDWTGMAPRFLNEAQVTMSEDFHEASLKHEGALFSFGIPEKKFILRLRNGSRTFIFELQDVDLDFQRAIEKGDLEAVKRLVAKGARLNPISEYYSRDIAPLVLAIKKGHSEIIRYLIEEAGADVNANSYASSTPLVAAIAMKNDDLTKYLIQKGADVNKPSYLSDFFDGSWGQATPLMVAARLGRTEIMCYLLDAAKAEVNATSYFHHGDSTALLPAIWSGEIEAVRLLLERDAYVDDSDSMGRTALMQAVRMGNKEMVELFLDFGAEVNAHAEDCTTALHVAYWSGYPEIAKLLIEHGADEETPDVLGKRPRDYSN